MIKLSIVEDVYFNDATQLDAYINSLVSSENMSKDAGTGLKLNGFSTALNKGKVMPSTTTYVTTTIPQMHVGVMKKNG